MLIPFLIPIKFLEIIRHGNHSNSDPKYQEKSKQKLAKNQDIAETTRCCDTPKSLVRYD